MIEIDQLVIFQIVDHYTRAKVQQKVQRVIGILLGYNQLVQYSQEIEYTVHEDNQIVITDINKITNQLQLLQKIHPDLQLIGTYISVMKDFAVSYDDLNNIQLIQKFNNNKCYAMLIDHQQYNSVPIRMVQIQQSALIELQFQINSQNQTQSICLRNFEIGPSNDYQQNSQTLNQLGNQLSLIQKLIERLKQLKEVLTSHSFQNDQELMVEIEQLLQEYPSKDTSCLQTLLEESQRSFCENAVIMMLNYQTLNTNTTN